MLSVKAITIYLLIMILVLMIVFQIELSRTVRRTYIMISRIWIKFIYLNTQEVDITFIILINNHLKKHGTLQKYQSIYNFWRRVLKLELVVSSLIDK